MNYNLLEENWIPVLYHDGRLDRIGIRKAFVDACKIRQVAASNPMDRLAILRFLLALLYWSKGNPPEQIPEDSFPQEWFKKLEDNKDCFNLLGDGKRLYQCKSKVDKTLNMLSANYLIHEVPTGSNIPHFRHSTDWDDGLCPACCAMGLLRLPIFATKGGRGKPPGINLKPPIYVIPLGSSLAETLRLSWRQVSQSELGTPTWERPDIDLPKTGKIHLLDGLTWVPRKVWLGDPDESKENCISCARKDHLIRKCVFAGIGSQKTENDDQGRVWNDPHIFGEKTPLRPADPFKSFEEAAGQWANVMAGVISAQKANGKVWVVAFATDGNKYIEAIEYVLPFPKALDNQKLQESIEQIKKWQEEGRLGQIRSLVRSKVTRPAVISSIRPHVEAKVSADAGALLEADEQIWEKATAEYAPLMTAVAKSISPGYTSERLERQRQIAKIKPDMGQKTSGQTILPKGKEAIGESRKSD